MRTMWTSAVALAVLSIGSSQVRAADPTWPKEMSFTIMATENPAEVTYRWGPILAQLEADIFSGSHGVDPRGRQQAGGHRLDEPSSICR